MLNDSRKFGIGHSDEVKTTDLNDEFVKKYGLGLINSGASEKKIKLMAEAFKLSPSNAAILKKLECNEKEMEKMLLGFRSKLDLRQEALSNVSLEEMELLVIAIDKGIKLQELFTEDGAYIDYTKILKIKFREDT